MHEQRGPGFPSGWGRRARSAGGRVLGHAGHALGEQHLGTEALVAFVDGELGLGAHQRAAAHVAVCAECSADVRAQVQARSAVRGAAVPSAPLGLLGALRGIPGAVSAPPEPPEVPPGRGRTGSDVVLDEHGAWVAVLRPERFGARSDDPAPPPDHRGRGTLGLVVLGVGLLAVGVLAAAPGPVADPSRTGAAPVQQARLQLPVPTPVATPQTATSPVTGQAVAQTAGSSSPVAAAPGATSTTRR